MEDTVTDTDTEAAILDEHKKASEGFENNWDIVVKPQRSFLDIDLKAIWKYRDLIFLLVRRDFKAQYKQTILGPLWFLLQPLITTLIFTIIFSKIAGISTEGVPPVLFYLAGLTCWSYFAECLTKTSNTFVANANIFGKVYFPRLVIPISLVSSNLIKFFIQFTIFLVFWGYFLFTTETFHPDYRYLLFIPVLIFLMAGLGLGMGIIISSLTTKYRDLQLLVGFGVQLLMYASPIVYPLSAVNEKYQWILLMNPMTAIIEIFKQAFLGSGALSPVALLYPFSFMLFVLALGVVIFNKVERSFMDTV